MDMYMAKDYGNYVFTSQDDWIAKIEMTDRRNCCMEISAKHVGDNSYFNRLVKLQTNSAGQHLFHYLLQRDISSRDLRDIPITDWKRRLMEMNTDPLYETLVFCRGRQNVFTQQLMANYNSLQRSERTYYKSSKGFNTMWKKYTGWESTNVTIGGKQKVGYILNDYQLLETVRRIRRDPHYNFPEDDSENEQ